MMTACFSSRSSAPSPDEIAAIRAAGRMQGANLTVGAGTCPFRPPDAVRHHAWMAGFSEGRLSAGGAA